MCFKLLGLVRMMTDLPNRAYPNDSVKSSLLACISFNTSCLQNTYYQTNENIFFQYAICLGKYILHTVLVCILEGISAVPRQQNKLPGGEWNFICKVIAFK